MTAKKLTPLQAIRKKCIECCAGVLSEVKLCKAQKCPLFEFKSGHRYKLPFSAYCKKKVPVFPNKIENKEVLQQ